MLLQTLRRQSIHHHSKDIQAPNLSDPALIRRGAGNYNAMCTGCHLAPGIGATELSKGLCPAPPNFTQATAIDPAHHFWVIKHGIKASGMPAWGKSMDDEYIWDMVAFLQQLPKLNEAQYRALVASSGGHSHGGSETGEHHHDEGEADDHDISDMDMSTDHHDKAPVAKGATHVHADGKEHLHAPPNAGVAPPATKPTAKPVKTDQHAGMTMPDPSSSPTEHTDDGHEH